MHRRAEGRALFCLAISKSRSRDVKAAVVNFIELGFAENSLRVAAVVSRFLRSLFMLDAHCREASNVRLLKVSATHSTMLKVLGNVERTLFRQHCVRNS